MKRIIKFRAYTEISNEVLGMKYDVPHNYNDTVMQFTGLLDRNGKEIYEGDIIKFIRNDGFENGEVFFEEGKFQVMNFYNQSQDNPCDAFSEHADLEVIGNIYENQKLLSSN